MQTRIPRLLRLIRLGNSVKYLARKVDEAAHMEMHTNPRQKLEETEAIKALVSHLVAEFQQHEKDEAEELTPEPKDPVLYMPGEPRGKSIGNNRTAYSSRGDDYGPTRSLSQDARSAYERMGGSESSVG